MKHKKLLPFIFALSLLLVFVAAQPIKTGVTKADYFNELDEADLCFVQTVEETMEEDLNITSLNYGRNALYNSGLEPFGYNYSFNYNGVEGCALMINRGLFYEIIEIYPGRKSPYADIDGLPVYLTPLCYIQFIDEVFYDIESKEALGMDIIYALAERGFGFEGGVPGTTEIETVNHTSTVEDNYRIPGTFPGYVSANSSLTNTCAVSAGSIILGYYGRFYPELLPNFTVGLQVGANYVYLSENPTLQNIINDLYVRMGTNVGGSGTTSTGFRNGLTTYANSKGRNISFTSVVSNNQLNLALYQSNLNNLRPVALFLNTYNFISEVAIVTEGNSTTIRKTYYGSMHVVISFGYKIIQYYNGSSNFRTDYFVRVATGMTEMKFGYIKLNDGVIVQEGFAAYIN